MWTINEAGSTGLVVASLNTPHICLSDHPHLLISKLTAHEHSSFPDLSIWTICNSQKGMPSFDHITCTLSLKCGLYIQNNHVTSLYVNNYDRILHAKVLRNAELVLLFFFCFFFSNTLHHLVSYILPPF